VRTKPLKSRPRNVAGGFSVLAARRTTKQKNRLAFARTASLGSLLIITVLIFAATEIPLSI
jgi:hypothetical protein